SSLYLQYFGRGVAVARVYVAAAGASIRKIGVARQRGIVAALSLVNYPAGDGDDSSDVTSCAVDCAAQTEYLGWHPHARHFQCTRLNLDRNGTRDAPIRALVVLRMLRSSTECEETIRILVGQQLKERKGCSMTRIDSLTIGKQPPLVTRVISVMAFASTIIALVAGLSLLWPGTILDILWKLNPTAQTEFLLGGRLVGLLLLCLGAVTTVTGVGLVKGKGWAWWLAFLLLVAVGAINLTRLLAGDPGEVIGTPLTLALLWLHVQPK